LTLQERVTTYFHGPNTNVKNGKPFYLYEEVDRGHGGDIITNIECSICGATGEQIKTIEEEEW
jgi:hypothetical protein